MIIYELICEAGHEFEGWFKDHESFQEQLNKKLVQCPTCGSAGVSQKLSTGGLVRTQQVEKPTSQEGRTSPEASHDYLKSWKNFIEKNFENVGAEFAQTALKMHYDAEEKRNIRGTTTEAEEKMLNEEGVTFYKIPVPDIKEDSDLH